MPKRKVRIKSEEEMSGSETECFRGRIPLMINRCTRHHTRSAQFYTDNSQKHTQTQTGESYLTSITPLCYRLVLNRTISKLLLKLTSSMCSTTALMI